MGAVRTDPSLSLHARSFPRGRGERGQRETRGTGVGGGWERVTENPKAAELSLPTAVPLKSPGTSLYTMSCRVLSDLGGKKQTGEERGIRWIREQPDSPGCWKPPHTTSPRPARTPRPPAPSRGTPCTKPQRPIPR